MPRFFVSHEDWPVIVANDETVYRAPAGTWDTGAGIDALIEIDEAQFRAKFSNLPELAGIYVLRSAGGGMTLAKWWALNLPPPAPPRTEPELDLTIFERGPVEIPGPIVLSNFDGAILVGDAGALLTAG